MKWLLGLMLSLAFVAPSYGAVRQSYGATDTVPRVRFRNVLVTAFSWADMESQNATIAAATRLKANLEDQGANVQVCFLPVIYDVAADVAMQCFRQMLAAPDLVLSLGETGLPLGTLEVVLAAANLDNNDHPDDRGTIRSLSVIDERFPADVSLMIPTAKLAPMIQTGMIHLRPHDAGGYVCNNLAFHLVNELHARKIPYLFVHTAGLPDGGYNRAGQLDESSGVRSGDLLTRMLSLF